MISVIQNDTALQIFEKDIGSFAKWQTAVGLSRGASEN
jgi:hypothetical protein